MVFSSLVFLWTFLPLIFIGYFLIQDNFKNIFLLLASLIFYSWGEPKYIFLMLCSILFNYAVGLFIDKYEKQKRFLLILCIGTNIGILAYFKYFNFIIEIVRKFIGKEIESTQVTLPIGISFLNFKILSYVIDL